MEISYLKAGIFTGLPFVGSGLITVLFDQNRQIKDWYNKLKLPSYKPPNWVFGPVWTGLYLSMGYSSYLIYRDALAEQKKLALGLYASQLALNWAWSPVFFTYHKLGASCIICIAMGANIAACVWKFYPINQTASYLMVPYLAWVTFASFLNYKIWKMNKPNKSND